VVVGKGSTDFVSFDYNLWKVKTPPQGIDSAGIINNQDPQFDSINVSKNYYDFRLTKNNSPAVDAGTGSSVAIDLDGAVRPAGVKPDLGCFEKQ